MPTHTLPCSSIQLRYKLHDDAPPKFKKAFITIKNQLESGEYKEILSNWVKELIDQKIGNINDRRVLNRAEGGIGGDDNQVHRQLRLCEARWIKPDYRVYHDTSHLDMDDIKLVALDSGDRTSSIWSAMEILQFGKVLQSVLLEKLYQLAISRCARGNCLHMFLFIDGDSIFTTW